MSKKRKIEIEMRKIGGKRGILSPITKFQIQKKLFYPYKITKGFYLGFECIFVFFEVRIMLQRYWL